MKIKVKLCLYDYRVISLLYFAHTLPISTLLFHITTHTVRLCGFYIKLRWFQYMYYRAPFIQSVNPHMINPILVKHWVVY